MGWGPREGAKGAKSVLLPCTVERFFENSCIKMAYLHIKVIIRGRLWEVA